MLCSQIGNHFMEELEFHCKCGSVLEDSIEDEYIQNSFIPFVEMIHAMLKKMTVALSKANLIGAKTLNKSLGAHGPPSRTG